MSNEENENLSTEAYSRKAFLKQSFGFFMNRVAESLPDFSNQDATEKPLLRPPGAIAEKAFLTTCEPFCDVCRNSCPRNAIFQDRFGFPVIYPEESPCVMCTDVPCTKVCPTDALMPLETPKKIALGTAIIEITECTAFQGSGCKVCYEVCPIKNEAILLIEGLPQIVPEACTGCGVCVFTCPTSGAISIRSERN